jgi:superfamily II DNA or RNA helicase
MMERELATIAGYPFQAEMGNVAFQFFISFLKDPSIKPMLLEYLINYQREPGQSNLAVLRDILKYRANLIALIPQEFELREVNAGFFAFLEELARNEVDFESTIRDLVVQIATGAGKTNLEAILAAIGLALDGKIIVICHRKSLAEQLAREFAAFLPGVSIAFDHSGKACAGVEHVSEVANPKIIITVDRTFSQRNANGQHREGVAMVIADESHIYRTTLDELSPPLARDTVLLRFSATAIKMKLHPSAEYCKAIAIGTRVWYCKDGEPSYEYSLMDGIEHKILAGLIWEGLRVNFSIEDIVEETTVTGSNDDFTPEQVGKFYDKNLQIILKTYIGHFDTNKEQYLRTHTIAKCASVKVAEESSNYICQHTGQPTVFVSGNRCIIFETNMDGQIHQTVCSRGAAKEFFEANRGSFLFQVNTLNEGYDFSDIGICWTGLSVTKSRAKLIQFIGRGTRLDSLDPDKLTWIVDILPPSGIGTDIRFAPLDTTMVLGIPIVKVKEREISKYPFDPQDPDLLSTDQGESPKLQLVLNEDYYADFTLLASLADELRTKLKLLNPGYNYLKDLADQCVLRLTNNSQSLQPLYTFQNLQNQTLYNPVVFYSVRNDIEDRYLEALKSIEIGGHVPLEVLCIKYHLRIADLQSIISDILGLNIVKVDEIKCIQSASKTILDVKIQELINLYDTSSNFADLIVELKREFQSAELVDKCINAYTESNPCTVYYYINPRSKNLQYGYKTASYDNLHLTLFAMIGVESDSVVIKPDVSNTHYVLPGSILEYFTSAGLTAPIGIEKKTFRFLIEDSKIKRDGEYTKSAGSRFYRIIKGKDGKNLEALAAKIIEYYEPRPPLGMTRLADIEGFAEINDEVLFRAGIGEKLHKYLLISRQTGIANFEFYVTPEQIHNLQNDIGEYISPDKIIELSKIKNISIELRKFYINQLNQIPVGQRKYFLQNTGLADHIFYSESEQVWKTGKHIRNLLSSISFQFSILVELYSTIKDNPLYILHVQETEASNPLDIDLLIEPNLANINESLARIRESIKNINSFISHCSNIDPRSEMLSMGIVDHGKKSNTLTQEEIRVIERSPMIIYLSATTGKYEVGYSVPKKVASSIRSSPGSTTSRSDRKVRVPGVEEQEYRGSKIISYNLESAQARLLELLACSTTDLKIFCKIKKIREALDKFFNENSLPNIITTTATSGQASTNGQIQNIANKITGLRDEYNKGKKVLTVDNLLIASNLTNISRDKVAAWVARFRNQSIIKKTCNYYDNRFASSQECIPVNLLAEFTVFASSQRQLEIGKSAQDETVDLAPVALNLSQFKAFCLDFQAHSGALYNKKAVPNKTFFVRGVEVTITKGLLLYLDPQTKKFRVPPEPNS